MEKFEHENIETSLRCNRCNKPITPQTAVHTPTGYRCKECVQGQQKAFDTAKPFDYIWAVVVTITLAFLGSLLAGMISFFTILLAPAAGWVIAEAVRLGTRKRRSKALFTTVWVCALLGAMPVLVVRILAIVASLIAGTFDGGSLFGLVGPAIFVAMVVPTAYYRLSGIQLR